MKLNFLGIGIILMVIGIIAFSGCAQNQNTVVIQNSTFNPSQKNIAAAASVQWINKDSTPHKIVSDTGIFESQTLNPGDSFEYTFYQEGTFNYHDANNSSITGKIIVTRSMGY